MKKRSDPLSKPHTESLSYRVEVTDKEGRQIFVEEALSRSFVQAWNLLVNVHAKNSDSTIKDTGGTDRSISAAQQSFECNAAAGVITKGVRVGKGSTAVTITDYALETPLVEGVGVNQLTHLIVVFTAPALAGSDCSFTIKRTMINNTGASITGIREIGVYMNIGATYYGLGFRDVLAGDVAVPDGGAITVTYTIKVTV